MKVFVLLFVLSVLNIGVGYVLAVYLGFGLPSFRDAWMAMGDEGPAGGANPDEHRSPGDNEEHPAGGAA